MSFEQFNSDRAEVAGSQMETNLQQILYKITQLLELKDKSSIQEQVEGIIVILNQLLRDFKEKQDFLSAHGFNNASCQIDVHGKQLDLIFIQQSLDSLIQRLS
jgi:hypothetical protein